MARILDIYPSRLFRYRPLDSDKDFQKELKAITDHFIWCSPFRDLNDPMEGVFSTSKLAQIDASYSEAHIIKTQGQLRTYSFSDNNRIDLMWAHYTKHKGICISYSTASLLEKLPNTVFLVRMSYADQEIRLLSEDVKVAKTAAIKTLAHTKSSWAYEREWRVIIQATEGALKYGDSSCIKAIYFGKDISADYKAAIADAIGTQKISTYNTEIRQYDITFSSYPPAKRKWLRKK